MFDDSFKIRYKDVPLAIWTQDNHGITTVHNHNEFEIICILEGKGEAVINDKVYPLKAGDMLFINPFEIHSMKFLGPQPYLHKGICFDCDLISDSKIADELKRERLHIINFIDSENGVICELQRLLKNIFECHIKYDRFVDMETRAYVSLMFALLLKNSLTTNKRRRTKNETFCTNVLQYIYEHYNENITSKDISAALSYNQSYFCRMFKACFDTQFNDYLNMYRVVEAKKRLQREDKSITQIALECGFNSQSYFAECFRRYVGMLPSEYRKSQQR